MKDTYTSLELANRMGKTVQAVHKQAKTERWQSRPRAGRGGGHEWLVSSMPEALRIKLLRQEEESAQALPTPDAPTLATAPVAEAKKGKALAKADLVALYVEWVRKAKGGTKDAARENFMLAYQGGGIVVRAITGGVQQLNSYADKHKYGIGKEYLYHAYKRLSAGPASSSGTLRVYVYGDSTVAGSQGESAPFHVQTLLSTLFVRRGLPNVYVVNRGVSGTSVGSMSANADVPSSDLIIIKYGINDGALTEATRLSTFATNLRSKLAGIRGLANGSIANQSIILVGPNSTSDTPNNRDERWYEQLRGVYIQAAREYKCAYFDTYAYLQDSRPAAGLWMDNPYGDGRAIHPLDEMQAWIWGGVVDFAFGESETRPYAANNLVNTGSVSGIAQVSWLPSQYPYGISIMRANAANGWPVDGAVITHRNADSAAVQQLFPYQSGQNRCISRCAHVAGNSWNRWTGVHEAIILANGWTTYGSPWSTPQAVLTADGLVKVKGLVKGGTIAVGTVVGTLPVGMRPSEYHLFLWATNAGVSLVNVRSDGQIVAHTTLDGTYTSLDGIVFQAAL